MFTIAQDDTAAVAAPASAAPASAAPASKAKAASSEVLTFSPTFRPKKKAPLKVAGPSTAQDSGKENTPRNANAEVLTFSPTFRPLPAKKDKPAVVTVLTLAVGGLCLAACLGKRRLILL